MFLHLSVSHSVHGGGVCFSACWVTRTPGVDTPGSRHPPGADTPPGADAPNRSRHAPWNRHHPEQTTNHPTSPWSRRLGSRHPRRLPREQTHPHPSPAQCMLGDTGNKRTVRILLECILISNELENKSKINFLPNIMLLYSYQLTVRPYVFTDTFNAN